MRCPRCDQLAPEGASICNNCDEILDASFLGDEEEVEGEATDIGPPPVAALPDRRPPRLRKPLEKQQRGSWEPRALKVQEERRPYLEPPPPLPAPSPLEEARKSADDFGSFYRALSLPDRWVTGSVLLLLLALFFPWRWTREDDDLIGLIAAWPVLLLGGGTLALIYYRSRKANALLDRQLRFAQLGSTALAALFVGLFIPWASRTSAAHAAGRTLQIAVSTSQGGAWFGLVCASAALVASIAALRD